MVGQTIEVIIPVRDMADHLPKLLRPILDQLADVATPQIEIGQPDDRLLGDLIVKLLGDRGIVAPPELPDYLVPRIERSYVAATRVVDLLDRAMLSHHRRITVPMAKRTLEEAGMIGRARNRA